MLCENENSGYCGERWRGTRRDLCGDFFFVHLLPEERHVYYELFPDGRAESFCFVEVRPFEIARVADAVLLVPLFAGLLEEFRQDVYRRLGVVRGAMLDRVRELMLCDRGRDVAQNGIRREAHRENGDQGD